MAVDQAMTGMAWEVSPFTMLAVGSAAAAVVVGVSALRRRPDPLAGPLALTMFAVAAWALPHGISFGFTEATSVAFWHQLRYPGTVVAPVAFFVLSVQYAGYDDWLGRRVYAILGLFPAITVAAVWTNRYHWLFWQSIAIDRFNETTLFVPEYGPLFWLNVGYLYLVTVAGLFVLAIAAVRSGPLYRKQAALIFVGGLVPLSTNVALRLGILPARTPDLTTTALAVTGVTFALALYHFDLLEIRPVARDLLIAELDDGVVVIGPNGRIRDFNPVAADILGHVCLDQPAEEVLPSEVVPDGGEIVVERDGLERTYRTRSSALTDSHGRDIGRIVYLNDITDLVRREQRISVLNRVLRHNIRNELNIAQGHIELVLEAVDGEQRSQLEAASESVAEVISFAERARYVERTVNEADTSARVAVPPVIDEVVGQVRDRHPGVTVTWLTADGADSVPPVRVVDEELLGMAIDELIENAVRHNDRDDPTVEIATETAGEMVRLHVADNGPGIPQQELDVLTATTETQLSHGSGLGLWLARWTAQLSGGHLSFDDNEPRGSVVTLTLPVAED